MAAPAASSASSPLLLEAGVRFDANGRLLNDSDGQPFDASTEKPERNAAVDTAVQAWVRAELLARGLEPVLLPATSSRKVEAPSRKGGDVQRLVEVLATCGAVRVAGADADEQGPAAAAEEGPDRQRRLLLLMSGTGGGARLGQWSKPGCVGDVRAASMLPLVDEAQRRGWTVVVLNPNDNVVMVPRKPRRPDPPRAQLINTLEQMVKIQAKFDGADEAATGVAAAEVAPADSTPTTLAPASAAAAASDGAPPAAATTTTATVAPTAALPPPPPPVSAAESELVPQPIPGNGSPTEHLAAVWQVLVRPTQPKQVAIVAAESAGAALVLMLLRQPEMLTLLHGCALIESSHRAVGINLAPPAFKSFYEKRCCNWKHSPQPAGTVLPSAEGCRTVSVGPLAGAAVFGGATAAIADWLDSLPQAR